MKTLIIIALVVLASVWMYETYPNGLDVPINESDSAAGENNGVAGRFMEVMYEMYWNPAVLIASVIAVVLASAGLVIYWRSIKD
jgi:hypothetical protein